MNISIQLLDSVKGADEGAGDDAQDKFRAAAVVFFARDAKVGAKRERERERDDISISLSLYIYIYIYIDRERWGFDYDFTNYNLKQTIELHQTNP